MPVKKITNKTIYILDTNVLTTNPDSIYDYPKSTIIIPISVIEELDLLKRHINETGRHARSITNRLDSFRVKGNFSEQGISLGNGSTLKIWLDTNINQKMSVFADMKKASNQILSSALSIKQAFIDNKIVLITNNVNLRLRAATHAIDATSYQGKKAIADEVYEELAEINLSDDDLKDFIQFDHISLNNHDHSFYANQHVKIVNQENTICRYIKRANYLKKIPHFDDNIWNITPRNLEQLAALDVLLDNSIDIVVLAGKAGTGKTLLALATALEVLSLPADNRKILVARPIVPLGKDLGSLPGDMEEKIIPWMKPIFDNLEFLFSSRHHKHSRLGGLKQILSRGLLELEALTYIRGRSIPNRFMIVDEAQNLTAHEIKTIITRIGHNTKLVLTGDPYQIDNPYTDSISNGLTYVIEKFKTYDFAAHVTLIKGERSRLAELAANIL
ncbi:MAG: PhoH family protein [SAR324 cluster bacterium]|nr:PhoH family protein [SAR324 cluster bacterium]